MFSLGQYVVAHHHTRSEIDNDRERLASLCSSALQYLGEQLETGGGRSIRARLQLEPGQEFNASTRLFTRKGLRAKAGDGIIDQRTYISRLTESARERSHQWLGRHCARC